MTQTKVSVVIPCYNYGQYLPESVDSVLASDYENIEIIVVDDGSNDAETLSVLESFSRPKTRIIRQSNQGVVAARNNGIKEAAGEYILPLDADDTITPDFIRKAVEILDAHSDIGIVYSDFQLIGEENNIAYAPVWNNIELLYNNICINTSLFRKKDWEKVGGYKAEMNAGYEDWEFWVSLSEIGVKGRRIPEALVCYRMHGESRNTIANKNFFENFKKIMKLHPDLYIDNIQYIIFPVLLKLMPYIPVGIKLTYTRRLFKNAFFSRTIFKNASSAFEYCLKRVIKKHFKKDSSIDRIISNISANSHNYQDNPLVSVIIPVYNVEKYLTQCLNSVVNQTYSNIEIICIDDASEDNSVEILKEYASKDARIKVLYNQKNLGLGQTRNIGINAARGEYIHFVDSDDWVKLDAYEKLKEIIDEYHPQMINFSFQPYNEKTKCYEPEFVYKGIENINGCFRPVDHPEFIDNAEAVWKVLYSRKFLQENNIIFTDVPIHEDTPFYMECLLKAERLYVTQQPLYYYRTKRPNSLIDNRDKFFDGYFSWYEMVENLLKDYNEEIYKTVMRRMCSSCIETYNILLIKNLFKAARYYKSFREFSINKNFTKYIREDFQFFATNLEQYPFLLYTLKIYLRTYCPFLLNSVIQLKKKLFR